MKRLFLITSFIFLLTLGAWFWYENSRTYPIAYGVNFNSSQATWLGLDWKDAYRAMLADLRPRYIRLSSFWNDIEPKKNTFDFSDLDWMMAEARRHGTKVALVVGMKQPRWPECHVPEWFEDMRTAQGASENVEKEQFFAYVKRVVERYRNHPALEIWQVENEPFIHFTFGTCSNYRTDWVNDEIALVRALDTAHRVMVTDSGELGLWRRAGRAGDIFGTTVYRAVRTPGGRRLAYDGIIFPVYYHLKAALFLPFNQPFFISELQAEPWLADGQHPKDTPLDVQEETMNPVRLRETLEYARHIGASRAYLWGAEWWYLMKTRFHDDRYWNIVKEIIAQ